MANKWIQHAIDPKQKGALHRALKVPMGKKIPATKLSQAAKRPGKLGRRARMAMTLRKMNHRTAKGEKPGRSAQVAAMHDYSNP